MADLIMVEEEVVDGETVDIHWQKSDLETFSMTKNNNIAILIHFQ